MLLMLKLCRIYPYTDNELFSQYITNFGSKFVFRTNCNAPNYQLVAIDLVEDKPLDFDNRTDPWPMNTLIPEHCRNVIEWSKCVNEDKMIVCYMEDVKNVMNVHDLQSGKLLYNIPLDIGSVISLSGKKDQHEVFYKFSSMITPGITYYLDMSTSPSIPKVTIYYSLIELKSASLNFT